MMEAANDPLYWFVAQRNALQLDAARCANYIDSCNMLLLYLDV